MLDSFARLVLMLGFRNRSEALLPVHRHRAVAAAAAVTPAAVTLAPAAVPTGTSIQWRLHVAECRACVHAAHPHNAACSIPGLPAPIRLRPWTCHVTSLTVVVPFRSAASHTACLRSME